VIFSIFSLIMSLLPYLLVLVVVFLLAIKRPFLYILLCLTYFAVTSANAPWLKIPQGTFLFGFNIYFEDLFTITALLSAFLIILIPRTHTRIIRIGNLGSLNSGLLLTVGIGIIFWSSTYGVKTGVNSWRELLMLIAFLIYGFQSRVHWELHHVRALMIIPGSVLSIIVGLRFATTGIGRSAGVDAMTGEVLDRATNVEGAYIIFLAFIGALYFLRDRQIPRILMLGIFGVEILLLQHRTIWIIFIVSLIQYMLTNEQSNKVFSSTVKLFSAIPLTLVAFFTFSRISLLSDASSNTHTLNWRIRRWVESMNTERSLSEWIFGSIFGPTPVTQVGLYGQFSHNAYVNQIEYLGFLGLFVFIVVLLKCYLRIRTLNSSRAPGKALMLSSILFGFTYQIPVAFFFLAPIFTQLAKNFESEIMESKIRENVNWNREIHRYGNTHA
jgi:hypothetical protein